MQKEKLILNGIDRIVKLNQEVLLKFIHKLKLWPKKNSESWAVA